MHCWPVNLSPRWNESICKKMDSFIKHLVFNFCLNYIVKKWQITKMTNFRFCLATIFGHGCNTVLLPFYCRTLVQQNLAKSLDTWEEERRLTSVCFGPSSLGFSMVQSTCIKLMYIFIRSLSYSTVGLAVNFFEC